MTTHVGEAFFGRKIPFLELLGARAEHREKGLAGANHGWSSRRDRDG